VIKENYIREFSEYLDYMKEEITKDRERIREETKHKSAHESRESVIDRLAEMRKNDKRAYSLIASTNLLRDYQPYRIGFGEMDIPLRLNNKDVMLKLIGEDQIMIPSLVKHGMADMGTPGFDEVAITCEQNREKMKKFPSYNLFTGDRRILLLGSLGLQDFTGHYLVVKADQKWAEKNIGYSEIPHRYGPIDYPIYVDEKYVDLYEPFLFSDKPIEYKFSSKIESDIENAAIMDLEKKPAIYGIIIGNSMESAKKLLKNNDVYIFGPPILQSETVIIVNRHAYEDELKGLLLKEIEQNLCPLDYTDDDRLSKIANYFKEIQEKIGEKWRYPPDIRKFYIDEYDKNTFAKDSKYYKSMDKIIQIYNNQIYNKIAL